MKNNKGFTIVELICVIALIAVLTLITVSVFDFKEKLIPENQSTLEEAVSTYYNLKYKNNELNYNVYYKSDGTQSMKFCVKYQTLLDEGYIEKEDIPDGYEWFVYEDGTITNILNSQLDTECKAQKINISDVINSSETAGTLDSKTVDTYEFSQVITQVDAETYSVASNFKINVSYKVSVETYAPVYMVFVLDRSGSMDGTPIKNATKAIENLSASLKAINDSAADDDGPLYCMSLVSFSNGYTGSTKHSTYTNFYTADFERKFSTSAFTNLSTYAPGGTCYNEGIGAAYTVIKNKSSFASSDTRCKNHVNDSDALNVVLFLSDGIPFDKYGNTSSSCNYGSSNKYYTEELKRTYNAKIFSISYNYTNNAHLRCIASNVEDAKGNLKLCNTYTDGQSSKLYNYIDYKDQLDNCNGKCVYYFESSTNQTELASVFNNFSHIVQEESKKTEYETATIEFALNDAYFKVDDSDSNIIKKTINLNDESVIKDGILQDNLSFNINLINDNITEKEIKLFKSIKIIVHDSDGNVQDKTTSLEEDELPKLNIYTYEASLKNE